MKSFTFALAFAASSTALVARNQPCCFTLTGKSSATSGTVGQLSDGQNRVGGSLPTGKYCMDSNGAITDSFNRGCALDSPNDQLQCDSGHSAQGGFSINAQSHQLEYNGQSTFWECPTGEDGEENLFSIAMAGNNQCRQLTLTADACFGCPKQPSSSSVASSPPSSSPASSSSASSLATSSSATSSSTATSSSASSSAASSSAASSTPASTTAIPSMTTSTPSTTECPKDLPPNAYQTPHLIVPIDSAKPSTNFGTSYFGQINGTFSSLFNFDVPSSYSGKQCSLIFTFPTQAQIQAHDGTSSYTFSGSGAVDVCQLSAIPSLTTNYGNKPSCGTDLGSKTLEPGTAAEISTFDCPAGQTVGYQMEVAQGSSVALNYFQDWNPCPLGLFMTVS